MDAELIAMVDDMEMIMVMTLFVWTTEHYDQVMKECIWRTLGPA